MGQCLWGKQSSSEAKAESSVTKVASLYAHKHIKKQTKNGQKQSKTIRLYLEKKPVFIWIRPKVVQHFCNKHKYPLLFALWSKVPSTDKLNQFQIRGRARGQGVKEWDSKTVSKRNTWPLKEKKTASIHLCAFHIPSCLLSASFLHFNVEYDRLPPPLKNNEINKLAFLPPPRGWLVYAGR